MDFLGGFLLLFACLQTPGLAESVAQTTVTDDLYAHLFTNYSTSLIPICNTGDNVTLTMDLALRQVMDLNEREQILTINVWLRLTWNDCRLTWNPTNYNSLDHILVKYSDIWVPDITLYDSAADEVMFPGRKDYRAYVSSSGSVSYNFPTVVTSVCRVNVKHFPFDTQRCSLQFGSWSHHGSEMDIVNKNPSGDLAVFVKNNEWIVNQFPVERHVLYYNCCPEPYPDVTFYIVLERNPAFYLLTMLFPCILVSIVAALTFLLPVESGEKVSLQITVLLSLAVFLLMVSETLPPASDNFPIIGSYFASSMGLVSVSLLQTVIVLNLFYRGTNGRQVPRWLRIVFFHYLGRVVCGRHVKVSFVDPDKTKSQTDMVTLSKDPPPREQELSFTVTSTCDHNDSTHYRDVEPSNGKHVGLPVLPFRDPIMRVLSEQTGYLKNMEQTLQDKKAEDVVNGDWRDIAYIMDRVFLIIYVLVTVITTLALLLQAA